MSPINESNKIGQVYYKTMYTKIKNGRQGPFLLINLYIICFFTFVFTCLTVVSIKGFYDHEVSGKCAFSIRLYLNVRIQVSENKRAYFQLPIQWLWCRDGATKAWGPTLAR